MKEDSCGGDHKTVTMDTELTATVFTIEAALNSEYDIHET